MLSCKTLRTIRPNFSQTLYLCVWLFCLIYLILDLSKLKGSALDTVEFIQIRRFIVKLGKMLHKYGTPAFRLEAYLGEVAKYLGVHASFISTPTSLTFVIWSDRHEDEYNHAARLLPGELDMNALSLTDELASELLSGKLTLSEADKRLNEIDAMGSPYGKWVTGVAFAMATGAFAMLMG
ncbi:uncharacterized protein METZ01_LOCUS471026, partial [marine metagenome]